MRLACIGNALIDILAQVDLDYPARIGIHPGSTEHASRKSIRMIMESLYDYSISAGGGAANTARAFVALGGSASFAGCIGTDSWGEVYSENLKSAGVDCLLQSTTGDTGLFLSLCDPNGLRSIVVDPGSAQNMAIEAIPPPFFSRGSTLYLDGFLALVPGLLEKLIATAKANGMPVAFDAGGQRLVSANRTLFQKIIREDASWVFMNEDEFVALAGESVDTSLASFAKVVKGILVVKRGNAGAVCIQDGQLFDSPVRSIDAMDTTGAGDSFAAGFLKAYGSGAPLARCMRMANWTAENAILHPRGSLRANSLMTGVSAFL